MFLLKLGLSELQLIVVSTIIEKNRSKPSIVSYDDEYVREPSIHAFEIEEEDHVGIALKKAERAFG